MNNKIPLKLVSLKLSKSNVTPDKKRTATSKSGINKVLKRVRENLESSCSNGSVQSMLFYIKNNEKDSQVKIVGFGPDASNYVDSEEFSYIKKKITDEMKSWKSVSCANQTVKKKTCSDGEEITGGEVVNEAARSVIKTVGNAIKRKVPPVNWKNLDKQARLQTVRDLYGQQKKSTTLNSTNTDKNSPSQEESQTLRAVEEGQFSDVEVDLLEKTDDDYNIAMPLLTNDTTNVEIVSGKGEETFRPLEEMQLIATEKNGKKKNQLSKEKVKKKKEEQKRKPKEAVTRDKIKRQTGEALAKEEEKRKKAEAIEKDEETRMTADTLAKEEEKRKEADAMAKEEEKRKIDEEKRKIDEEKRKKDEAMTKDEEKRKIVEAFAEEEEKQKREEENQKIDEEKWKKIEAMAKDEENRMKAGAMEKDEETQKIDALANEEEKREIDEENQKKDEKKRNTVEAFAKEEEKRKKKEENRKIAEEKRKKAEAIAIEEEKKNRELGKAKEYGRKSFPKKINKGRGRPRKKCSSLRDVSI